VESTEPVTRNAPLPIKGIGALTGGMAIVIVEHLDPDHEGMLDEPSASARPQGAEDGLS